MQNSVSLISKKTFVPSELSEKCFNASNVTRIPSSSTDTDEDKGYRSWENAVKNKSPEIDNICMPPPKTELIKHNRKVMDFKPPSSAAKTPQKSLPSWVTSTPVVDNVQNRVPAKTILLNSVLRKSAINNMHTSMDWDSADDQENTNCSSICKENVCDHELCNCQPQIKFSFAINCDESESMCHSTLSSQCNDADVESLSSDDLFLDEKVLSGDRLSQMTRTYHDIEAVTHLLEEKERDLELAARIGQTLLQKNRDITQRNEQLEEQLASALEEASQLRHEISLKEDLLHIYADDETDSSGAPSPVKELKIFGRAGMYSHIESLQSKIHRLESENVQLKLEQEKLKSESENLETKEQQLVVDAVKEMAELRHDLKEAHENINLLTEELNQKNEESVRQQEEITRLLTQIVDMQRKQKQLALENEELQLHLTAANNTQYELTKEIQGLEQRYQEVSSMLEETREENRMLRDYPEDLERSVPFGDSLAAELECSGGMFADVPSTYYNPSSDSIDWSSPPSSVVAENNAHIHAQDNIANSTAQSEPTPQIRSESFSQRVINTARFVNKLKNISLNSKMQYVTPLKQDRPIPTPLAIPGHCKSPLFTRASPDSSPSSGHCMSSTPCDNHRPFSRSSLAPFDTPMKSGTPPHPPAQTRSRSLRLQLANKTLANKVPKTPAIKTSFNNSKTAPIDSSFHTGPMLSSHSLSPMNTTVQSTPVGRKHKRAFRSWHGESIEVLANGLDVAGGVATPSLGRPGVPGTEDLERAIRKLALRREGAKYMEMEKRLETTDSELFGSFCDSGGTMTPGSNLLSGGQTPPPSCPASPKLPRHFRITGQYPHPPKLRIVKPLEGSVTLNQWKYLAERNHQLASLEPKVNVPSGVITREHVAEVLSKSRDACSHFSESEISKTSSPQANERKARKSAPGNLRSSSAIGRYNNSAFTFTPPKLETRKELKSPIRENVGDVKRKSLLLQSLPSAKELQSNVNLGKNFALTSTRYTLTNSRVINPSDQTGNAFAVSSQSVTLATSGAGSLPPATILSSAGITSCVSTFIQLPKSQVSNKFFKENTRTCSMLSNLSHLLKEHGAREPHDASEYVNNKTHPSEAKHKHTKATEPPAISIENSESSAFTKKVVFDRRPPPGGHVVWNRSLQRSFLLPSHPTQNIFFNFNRCSDQRNPETPPNSPLSSTPSHSTFLLNEIMARPSPVEEKTEKKQEEPTFSSNLLSKLAQLGITGFSGFRAFKSTATHSNTAVTTTTCSTKASTATASNVHASPISKSATAPGSLLNAGRDPLAFACIPAHSPERRARNNPTALQATCSLDSNDKGLRMKPAGMDWADLHGSSGALNHPVADSTCRPRRTSGECSHCSNPPIQTSTPNDDPITSDSDVEDASANRNRRRVKGSRKRVGAEVTAASPRTPRARPNTLIKSNRNRQK